MESYKSPNGILEVTQWNPRSHPGLLDFGNKRNYNKTSKRTFFTNNPQPIYSNQLTIQGSIKPKHLGGGFKYFLMFTPTWGNDQF